MSRFLTSLIISLFSVSLFAGHPALVIPSQIKPNSSYIGAGILPVGRDAHNKLHLLFAINAKLEATDLGGHKEKDLDNDNPYLTAAREACEECMYILDNKVSFKKLLELRNKFGTDFDVCKTNASTYQSFLSSPRVYEVPNVRYNTYIVERPFSANLPVDFQTRRNEDYGYPFPLCWIEKKALVWIPLDQVREAIKNAPSLSKVFITTPIGDVQISKYIAATIVHADTTGIFADIISPS